MMLVALGVCIACLVVTNHAIVPIGQIHGAVGAHAHIHGAKRAVGRNHDSWKLRRAKSRPVIFKLMQLHQGTEITPNQSGTLNGLRHGTGAHEIQRCGLGRGIEQISYPVILLGRGRIGLIGDRPGPASHGTGTADHSRHGPITLRAVSCFVEYLPIIIFRHTPAIGTGHAAAKEAFQEHRLRAQSPDGRTIQALDSPGSFHQ